MCGINVLWQSAYLSSIEEMNQSIAHRGLPGRTGSQEFERISLGHVRLPIQGLSTEYDMPMKAGRYWFAFVGEITNFKSVGGSRLKSDVELIRDCLAKLGLNDLKKILQMFDGFWSIVVYDDELGQTTVITDPLCKKPLYALQHRPQEFDTFDRIRGLSSEIKPLLGNTWRLGGRRAFDDRYFAQVAKFGYCLDPERTPFFLVKKIPPGVCWTFDNHGNKCESFRYTWARPYDEKTLFYQLSDSVRDRMISDVPVALLVSGGLDSTIIAQLALKHREDLNIFHIAGEETEYLNDIPFPTATRVHSLEVKDQNVDEVLWYNEGPVDLGSMLPQYQLGAAIKEKGFHVVLSGDGADEVFGGYRRQRDYDAQQSDVWDELVLYHLPRLDKLMMAHTIELRCPFLSYPVVETGLGLPYTERIDKKFVKEMFAEIVPDRILSREKYPLKSRQVVEGGVKWRMELIQRFKQVIKEKVE